MATEPEAQENHTTRTGYGLTSEELILTDGDSEDEYDEDDDLFGRSSSRSPTDGTGYSKEASPIEIFDEPTETHEMPTQQATSKDERENIDDDVEIVMESYVASASENRSSKMDIKELISEGVAQPSFSWHYAMEKLRSKSAENQRRLDAEKATKITQTSVIDLDSDDEQHSQPNNMSDEKHNAKEVKGCQEQVQETQESEPRNVQSTQSHHACMYSPKSPLFSPSPSLERVSPVDPLHVPKEVEQAWRDTWRYGPTIRQTDLPHSQPKTVSGNDLNMPDLITRTKLAFEQVNRAGLVRQRAEEFLRIRKEIDGQKYLPEPSIAVPAVPMPEKIFEKIIETSKEHRPYAYPESPMSCNYDDDVDEDDSEDEDEDCDFEDDDNCSEHESPLTSPMVPERSEKYVFSSINNETEDENACSEAMEADDVDESVANRSEHSEIPLEQVKGLDYSATFSGPEHPLSPPPPPDLMGCGLEQSFLQSYNDSYVWRKADVTTNLEWNKWSTLQDAREGPIGPVIRELPDLPDFKTLKRSFDEYNDDPFDKENIEDRYEDTTLTDAQPSDVRVESLEGENDNTVAVADDSSVTQASSHTIELESSVKRIKLTDSVTNDDGWVKSIKTVVVPTLVGAVLGSAGMFAALVASAPAE